MGGLPALPTGSAGDGGQPGWTGRVVENDDGLAYTATAEQVEEIRRESLAWYRIPYTEAERSVQETLVADIQKPSLDRVVAPYEVVVV